jgi:hypothetical protein
MPNTFPIVVPCRSRDLLIFRKVVPNIIKFIDVNKFVIICPYKDIRKFKSCLGNNFEFIAEDDLIPEVTKKKLLGLKIIEFPQAVGWYYQQFLKMHYSFVNPSEEYYLIWDSDTIPLRKMKLFTEDGKIIMTKADEFHKPYFETYYNLLGQQAQREFSMIAQHMMVNKSRMREMISQFADPNYPWPLTVLDKLTISGKNRFSEYETFGHYMKIKYPGEVIFVNRPWLRISEPGGAAIPSNEKLLSLSENYDFVAFERAGPFWRKLFRMIKIKSNIN